MASSTRNRREQRLVDELLIERDVIRELQATNARLQDELRSVVALATESAGLGPALCDAVGQLTRANEDLRAIEVRHGIQRPSRHVAPTQPADFVALWRSALADPT